MSFQLTLPNGLTLLGDPFCEFQSAAFAVTTGVGSVWDPQGKYGMAAFVCEMMLRGAGKLTNRQFLEKIAMLGIDRTESLTASNLEFRAALLKENLEDALELYADLIRNPRMPKDELEAGRQVLLREVSSIDDCPEGHLERILEERFYGKAWGHDVDGVEEEIETISWEEIREHYETFFMPNRCIMSVTGNFDWDRIAQKVEALFGDWERKKEPTLPEFAEEKETWHWDFDSPQTQIGLAWEIVPYPHQDRLKAWAAINVLSGGMNSRLFNEVREKRGLCYDLDARCHSFRTKAGVFCTASCRQDNAQQTLEVILQEIRRLEQGISEEELRAYQARYRMALVMARESCQAWASDLIGDWVNFGRIRSNEELLRSVENLTIGEINEYVKSHPVEDILLCTLGREALHL